MSFSDKLFYKLCFQLNFPFASGVGLLCKERVGIHLPVPELDEDYGEDWLPSQYSGAPGSADPDVAQSDGGLWVGRPSWLMMAVDYTQVSMLFAWTKYVCDWPLFSSERLLDFPV